MRAMQSMFRRKSHQVPSLNVASMPDLIFTVLFFFMIVTHMRSDELKVKVEVPAGKEVQKLAAQPSVVNIYIGRASEQGEWQVQLNGHLVSLEEIPDRISDVQKRLAPEAAGRLTVSLRIDRHAPMGIVSDVKQALQQAYALKINYSGTLLNTDNYE